MARMLFVIPRMILFAIIFCSVMPAENTTAAELPGDSAIISSLPIHTYRARVPEKNRPLLVIISGDGGWNSFIDGLAAAYAEKGMDVAGIDALKYFWHKSDPKSASGDFARVIRYYSEHWHNKEVIFLGYSFGADVLPFIFNNFPPDLRQMISLLVLMSPSHHASFEFQLTGWLKGDEDSPYKVVPEIKKISGPDKIIIYGKKEKETLTGDLPPGCAEFVAVEGGHHFNDDYAALTLPVMRKYAESPHHRRTLQSAGY